MSGNHDLEDTLLPRCQGSSPQGGRGSLVEKVDAGAYTSSGRQVHGVHTYLGITKRHPGPDLAPSAGGGSSSTRRGSRRRPRLGAAALVLVVVERVGEVEAERSTAPDALVGDEARLRTLAAVDVDDRRPLAGPRRRVAADDRVTYRHLANDIIIIITRGAAYIFKDYRT